MIYIFDNKQKIIKVLTNEDLTAGHLDFKINTATTFEFSLPANKPLSSSAKFVAVPHPLDDSKFIMLRLTERTDNADTIDYSAYELAYQELATYGYIEDKRPAETDAKTLMGIALNGTNWKLNNVNVAGTAKTNFYYMDHLTAISNVVDLLGGEIVFYVEIESNAISGRYMDYLARQGEDTSKVFAKGSNLLTIERQSDTSGIYTAILPRGKGVETDGDNDASTPDGYGRRLNIADAVWKKSSGKPLDKPAGEIILYDPTANAEWGQIDGNYRLLLETYDEIDDVNTLINSAYKTLQSVNHPKIQYSATVADVGGLSLGDTVLIMHSERDLSYKTRVFEVNYDLLDPAQTEISLGDDLSSNDITSQINRVSSSQSIASEQTQWTINHVGRNPVTFGTVAPENPKVGDTFFKYLPNGDTVVYEWNGEIWVEKVSSNISEQIDLAVEDTIETAKSQATAMDEVRASEAAVFQSEANAALSSAAVERAVFSSNAASMANSASAHADTVANSASAYAKAQANSALSSANSELAKAKQELGSEVSKAQSDIIAANNELAGKVSQTDFDTVTRDLTTKYGQVKATADAVTADVAKYETANDKKVSANTASINALNNQITSKVSQTDFDKTTGDLSGKYSVQQQTINGISQTVTELQAKANAQGQVNQLMNTEFNPDLEGWTLYADKGSNAPYASFATYGSRGIGFNTVNADASTFARLSQTILLPSTRLSTDVMSLTWRVNTRRMDNYCHIWLVWQDVNGVSLGKNTMGNWNDSTLNKYNVLKWENISIPIDAKQVDIRFETREGTNAYIFQPMVSFTNTIGDYVPGNYNNNARVAALELGIDHITGLVMDPKNGLSATATLAANGLSVATKAQSDATTAIQTAKGTQTTVTSVQKDVKDLQSTTTQTADQVTTEIEDRKNGDKNTLTLTSQMISDQIADYNLGVMLNMNAMANGIYTSISTPNQLLNTEFNPDLEGWTLQADSGSKLPYRSYFQSNINATVVGFNTTSASASTYAHLQQKVQLPSTPGSGHAVSMSWYAYTGRTDNYNNLWVRFYDNSNKKLAESYKNWADLKGNNPSGQNSWNVQNKWENITVPDTATYLVISFDAREGTNAYLGHPMLVFGSTIGDAYMPGTYSGMNTSTVLQLFKDNWAIGIQDNTFEMVSGIIGDNTSMNLISNNITLRGNTTVTEDFYAKGGNFKNLNASNITTGTINAAKINVINLDVSSLSGNITNFVKSYWNNAYGDTVTINGSQIAFYTNSKRSNTTISEGKIDVTVYNNYTKTSEHIGGLAHFVTNDTQNQDLLSIYIDGYKTIGGSGHTAAHGGDGFGVVITNGETDNSAYELLTWENELIAGSRGRLPGWHFNDHTEFHSDVMMFPDDAYQGLYFGTVNYNNTTYPAIMGNQKKDDGPGIAFGSTELYFLYKNTMYPLSVVLKAAAFNI
jgi:phage minor structural protein